MNEADRRTAARHREIWEAFRTRREATPLSGRPQVPPEIAATLGFVIPVDAPAVCDRLSAVVARLEATGCVVPFRPDYWHITIVPPAFIGRGEPDPPRLLPKAFVEDALARGREAVRGLAAFEVEVRGLNAFRDVVVGVPYDGGRGLEMGRLIRAAVPEMPDRYPDGNEPLPHISLAQYSRGDGLEALVDVVESERETGLGRLHVRELSMFVLPWENGVAGRVQKHAMPLEV
jgi:hypothetical protein